MAKRDFYEVLGVARGADEAGLKSAYRKLAMQFHPDRNPGDHEAEHKFKEINEANEVLSDSEKRKMYDRFGEDWQRYRDAGFTGDEPQGRTGGASSSAGGPTDFGQWFSGQSTTGPTRTDFGDTGGDGFSDFFRTIFGSRGNFSSTRPSRQRGEDLETEITVSFEESFRGTTRRVDSQIQEPCTTCGGTGYVREAPCPTCDATGLVSKRHSLEVKIPAGILPGQQIRLAGQGHAGAHGGPAGDLYIFLSIKPHAIFQRDGADLFCRVPIGLVSAALGGEIEVPTLSGEQARVKIPEGTQTGKQFRLKGKGMSVLRSRDVGDLYIQVVVETPQKLTTRQRELLEEFEQVSSEENNPESAGFFARIRDFFGGT